MAADSNRRDRSFLASPRHLLDHLAAGGTLDQRDLTAIVSKFEHESDYHDFKGIEIADNRNTLKLRTSVASFANSDGGVVFVGIDEGQPRTINAKLSKLKGTLATWVANTLKADLPQYSPIPKVVTIETDAGQVAAVVVRRGHDYVRVNGVIYLRIGDSSSAAPDYLRSDLLLGRRAKPRFDLELVQVSRPSTRPEYREANRPMLVTRLDFQTKVTNSSVTWAEDVRIGFVYSEPKGGAQERLIPSALMEEIDFVQPPGVAGFGDQLPCGVLKTPTYGGEPISLAAFQSTSPQYARFSCSLPAPHRNQPGVDWMAAVYVVARNSVPVWFQVSERLRPGIIPSGSAPPTMTKLLTARPTVGLRTES